MVYWGVQESTPILVAKCWVVCYSVGVRGKRRVARLCEGAMRWLMGRIRWILGCTRYYSDIPNFEKKVAAERARIEWNLRHGLDSLGRKLR